ncbi:MAG: hypothetical protein LLF28_00910 [Nitrospiraceae bacterium]|nr:hypothetical protein [Nitrospiraceae bacterium]
MTRKQSIFLVILITSVLALVVCFGIEAAQEQIAPGDTVAPQPPITKGFFPCSNCHATMPANAKQRTLTLHTEIKLQHMTAGWCFNCHNPNDRNKLKLADGQLVDITNAVNLCAQCHGRVAREWKAGTHGKRIGMWTGKKLYENCLNCHNPHSPAFQAIKPLQPPMRPENIKLPAKTK